jgi:PKD repeat protein
MTSVPLSTLFKAFAAVGLTVLAAITALNAPAASFTISTPNPAANSVVQFTDSSTGAPTSWAWDFGDGGASTQQNPAHVYASPGSFNVRLTATNASGSASATLAITVTPATVLRLNAAHSFDLTLSARDPRTGNTGDGTVIGQNDVYGYFSIPSVSGNAGNPEVIVKMVDATAIGQNYWVFYGCMTDLEYTLRVKENATGAVKTYTKDVGKPCGQFDTSGFLPTATPTVGPPPTPTPTTAAGPVIVNLNSKQFDWSFNGGGSSFTATVGVTYQLRISDSDPARTDAHGFSGIPALGLSGADLTPSNNPPTVFVTRTFTPTSAQVGTHAFSCSNSGCGIGHDGMIGRIIVVR